MAVIFQLDVSNSDGVSFICLRSNYMYMAQYVFKTLYLKTIVPNRAIFSQDVAKLFKSFSKPEPGLGHEHGQADYRIGKLGGLSSVELAAALANKKFK
jgi:hypothetical protein